MKDEFGHVKLGVFTWAEGEFFIELPMPVYNRIESILRRLYLYGEHRFPKQILNRLLDLNYILLWQ